MQIQNIHLCDFPFLVGDLDNYVQLYHYDENFTFFIGLSDNHVLVDIQTKTMKFTEKFIDKLLFDLIGLTLADFAYRYSLSEDRFHADLGRTYGFEQDSELELYVKNVKSTQLIHQIMKIFAKVPEHSYKEIIEVGKAEQDRIDQEWFNSFHLIDPQKSFEENIADAKRKIINTMVVDNELVIDLTSLDEIEKEIDELEESEDD